MSTETRAPSPERGRLGGGWIVLLFFFSGSAGLVYEVIWNRLLALEMGNTAYSLAAILTVFMGGLALGSFVGGRFAHRVRNGMRVYGLLEIGIGVYCLALPRLIDLLHPVTSWAYREHYGSFLLFNLLQFALVGLVLLLPVTAMGATLPVVAEHVTKSRDRVATSIGTIYAVNTVGAFAGCLLAGLWLHPEFGLTVTNRVAVGLNVGVGLVAVALATRSRPTTHLGRAAPAAALEDDQAGLASVPVPLLLAGFGVSGFAAMSYQVAWTRAIGLSIGSASYAFTLIVSAFILGLALGAAVLGRLGENARRTLPLLIGSQLGLALAAACMLPFFDDLPAWVAQKLFEHKDSFAAVQAAEFTMVFLLVLVPTFLMGGTLPLVCKAISREEPDDVGAVLGRAYASNTLGTILGSFTAGFVLVPQIGMRGAILFGIGCNALVAGGWIFAAARRRPAPARIGFTAVAAVPLVVFWAMPEWNVMLMTSAPYIDGHLALESMSLGKDADDYRAYIDGRYKVMQKYEDVATTVTIAYDNRTGDYELRVGGKVDAKKLDSAQAFLAHLPLSLHPDPQDVLIIGLGSGGTLTSALGHESVRSVQDVELSGAVVEASRKWFGRFEPFADPRAEIIVGDGRQHVAMTDRKYDVLVSQPSNPWIVGASALFTADCFEEMKARLKPGGIVCIWMQAFQIGHEPVETLFATFASVFEHMDVWESASREEYFLTGYLEPFTPDPDRVARAMEQPGVREDMQLLGLAGPMDLLSSWVADREALAPLIEGDEISTDDHNLLEARIPRGLLLGSPVEIARLLMELRRPVSERLGLDPADPADAERIAAADRLFRSKEVAFRIFEAVRTRREIRFDLLPELRALNPGDAFIPLIEALAPAQGMDAPAPAMAPPGTAPAAPAMH